MVIDDDVGDAEILRRSLEAVPDFDADILHFTDAQAGLAEFARRRMDLVFLDYRLGAGTGLEILKEMRSSGHLGPIVVLSGQGDEHIAAEIMRAGADDYLIKDDVSPRVLGRSIKHAEARYLHRKAEIELLEKNALLAVMLEWEKQTSKQLEEAMERAEAANRAKSEFLAKMSHELRTPMNSIIGFTELMMEDADDAPTAKRRRRLEKVHRNARNLLALLNDILDLSKIEADRLSVERRKVDVAAVLNECLESARPLVKNDQVELRGRITRTLPTWQGDSVRLRQIVTNLLGNAAKFTETGHIELRGAVEGDRLRIEVEDTGIGISPEDLPRIFETFQQVDSSSTRRAGGTGLGLAICRRLCALLEGEITARSEPGVGSCFTVLLPMTPKAAGTDEERGETGPETVSPGVGHTSASVLGGRP
jgi:signal transduction histidine kinase